MLSSAYYRLGSLIKYLHQRLTTGHNFEDLMDHLLSKYNRAMLFSKISVVIHIQGNTLGRAPKNLFSHPVHPAQPLKKSSLRNPQAATGKRSTGVEE